MIKVIKEKDGKYRIRKRITLGDILLVLIIVVTVCLIVIICEV